MKLRSRLIVAFLSLSVLPLAVVTFYTYSTNVDAMQEVATREADLLAGELSDRMQLVTAQLSERIEHLMDVQTPAPAESAQVAEATRQKPKPEKPAAPTSTPATPSPAQFNEDVASALGEAAILLNSVQMQGGRGFGRPPCVGGGGGAGGAGGAGASGNREGRAGVGPSFPPGTPRFSAPAQGGLTSGVPSVPVPPVRPATPLVGPPPPPPATGAPTVGAPTTPPAAAPTPPASAPAFQPGHQGNQPPEGRGNRGPGANPGGGTITLRLGGQNAGLPGAVAGDESTQIDLTQIRRDLYQQILPSGKTEGLTPEERQRVAREVNQRMLGIVQGIKLSAIELQKKADAARIQAGSATSAAAGSKPAPTPAAPPTPTQPPAAAVAATPPGAPATSSASSTSKRTAALVGNRLAVQVTRNGEVVRSANAEINLPNVLMTVFSTMPHEQGEVAFAVDKDGKLYTQSDEDRKKVESLGSVAGANGPLGKTVLPDWIVVTTAEPSGSGLRFGIARPVHDSLTALRQAAGKNAAFGLLFIGLALVGVAPLSTRLTRNLSTLTEGVRRIALGDYAARVSVKSHDEIGALATAFNQMAEDVEKHQRSAVEQERIRRELELGRQIQHDMQPHGSLRLGLTEIAGVSVPAREVGGDFFNYFELASGHIAMLVGDVSGKGVGAALLMANIQASLRTRLALGQDLAAVAEGIDHDITSNPAGPLYATLFVGILDPVTRMLRYVNAGHYPQFVLRRQGGLECMESTGLPVGLLPGRGYNQVEIQLAEGDRLFFYTDGCVDTENEHEDMFGAERLENLLRGIAGTATPQEVLLEVERAIEQFRGSRELFDDVTAMAVRVG